MGEQQTHWETNILLLRTSVKKLHTSKKKTHLFLLLTQACCLLQVRVNVKSLLTSGTLMLEKMKQAHSAGKSKNVIHFLFPPKRRFHYNHKLYILLRVMSKIITIQIVKEKDNRVLTNGMPLVALSSKNLDGLKKLPYSCDHFFRLV